MKAAWRGTNGGNFAYYFRRLRSERLLSSAHVGSYAGADFGAQCLRPGERSSRDLGTFAEDFCRDFGKTRVALGDSWVLQTGIFRPSS